MRRVYVALAAVVLLSGCALEEPSATVPSAGATPTASETELTEQQRKEIREGAGIPEDPSPANRKAFLAALNAIDPDIVHGKPDKAISRAKDTCSSAKTYAGQPKKLVGVVQRRWTSPTHPEGRSPAVARRIFKAVRKYICP